jgi:hypothetical protein
MKNCVPKYDTDALMEKIFKALAVDMKRCLGYQGELAYAESAKTSRSRQLLLPDNLDAYTYKWCAQLSGFLKRYTFKDDPITPAEREELTDVKFIKLQEGLASIYWRRRSMRLHEVLRRARSHANRILCGFSPKEVFDSGQFGTKATVGCPAAHAYIDEKLLHRPITGSALHLRWFNNDYLPGDQLLGTILQGAKIGQVQVDRLSQVNVRKKWNIDRGINPNTLIGSLHSSALGRILELALRKEGLDIRRLQNRHAKLISQASKDSIERDGYIPFVTADLSNASHSFLSHHLNALLPREWYNACMTGVIRNIEVGQRVMRLESIMTMGIGFTFPMQTLLFYCILVALQELLCIKGRISVYGDDLIYPRRLHPYVVSIFNEMGFQLNLDKTFVKSPFRESCGSDWFKGVDVRPFSPEGQSQSLGRVSYGAFCYKLLNGLLRRWDEVEVELCSDILKTEICDALGMLFYVPSHYPDFSGFKVNDPWLMERNPQLQYYWPSCQNQSTIGHGTLQVRTYTCIKSSTRRRYVTEHSPYYWDWLRSRGSTPEDADSMSPIIESTPTFEWTSRKSDKRKVVCHDKIRRRKHAFVAMKQSGEKTAYELTFATVCSPHTEER